MNKLCYVLCFMCYVIFTLHITHSTLHSQFNFMDDVPAEQPATKTDMLKTAFGSESKQKAEPKKETKEPVKPEVFYPFVSGDLDTSDSCWYDAQVYLLVVKTTKKAVITILPYGFRFYEGSFSPRNGFEKKVRENKTDIICWGQSSQTADPRAYFFLEPVGQKESYQIYIQRAIGDKVSEPILFTFRRAIRERSIVPTEQYMGGLPSGGSAPSPSGRARLKP